VSGYFDRNQFIPSALAKQLIAETEIRVGPDRGSLWVYSGGVFREDRGEASINRRIGVALGDLWRPNHANATRQWLRENCPRVDVEKVNTDLINVRNGMLNWRTGELLQHDPKYGSIVQAPWNWNPAADCPRFRAAFAHLADGLLALLFEIAGYLLYPADVLKKAILFYGPGDTGKSTVLDCLRSLVGRENTSAQTLQSLADERFARSDLFGKSANICGDLDARAVRTSDTFKMLTGGDVISAERKGRDHFNFVNRATLVFSANELPKTQDQTDAWFNRFLIVPFPTKLTAVDPRVKSELPEDEAEMEGLLRHGVEGIRALMQRGMFPTPEAVTSAASAYRESADSTRSFFMDERYICTGDENDFLPRADLYRQYRAWCQENGRLIVSAETFYNRIRQDGLGVGLSLGKANGGTTRVVRGVRYAYVV
jgi:putative DNA primase/helicase